ncbi:MAG: calcineurin-like phosphoesterase C-terminal domain-containing protein [Arenimonas sp.]|nr:calcineurin-like phosphoesterase C-terminal domain-containing protein [Arenimonas sp.]
MRLACLLTACLLCSALSAAPAAAITRLCNEGIVFHDLDGDGLRGRDEPALPGVAVSDGQAIVRTNVHGEYSLPVAWPRTTFVIKPAGWQVNRSADGLPKFWRHLQRSPGPALKYGGIPVQSPGCRNFALVRDPRGPGHLRTLVFGDPQPRTATEAGYYERGIVEAVMARHASPPAAANAAAYLPRNAGDLGLTLGDVVHDDLSLYPQMNRATARLGLPWLHVAGNHDLDFDATRDEDSLLSFRNTYGPDTFAWEEHEATFVLLDNVVYQPGQKPDYVGGLREDQFAFLAAYLPTVPRGRRLVVAAHIPFFEPTPGRETFRAADRKRLFAMLAPFPNVLLLTAHGHVQRHHLHDAASGWRGEKPLHEYNLGAACGAYWSGVPDASGIPVGTMADGTPRGWAELSLLADARYSLRWHAAAGAAQGDIGLHAPKVLRRGAYPAFGVFANVYMALPDAVVEFRVGDGAWAPMQRVARADPRLLVENVRDDLADGLRGFDRSPEAAPSTHLWRGTLPTDLPVGEHRIQVRTRDAWRGLLEASATYRLADAVP